MRDILASSSSIKNLEQELSMSGQLYKDQYEYLAKKLAYHDSKVDTSQKYVYGRP